MPSSLACTPEAQRKCHRTRHPFEEQPEDLRLLGRVELSPSRVKKTTLPT
jgi:hypothetical protein